MVIGYQVVRQSADDKVLVVGGGVTLHEAVKAAEELAKENIHIRVMDLFTVKPVDQQALIEHGKAVGGRILTVEDHYYEGILVLLFCQCFHRVIKGGGYGSQLIQRYDSVFFSIISAMIVSCGLCTVACFAIYHQLFFPDFVQHSVALNFNFKFHSLLTRYVSTDFWDTSSL